MVSVTAVSDVGGPAAVVSTAGPVGAKCTRSTTGDGICPSCRTVTVVREPAVIAGLEHLQEASQWERLVASLSELNWVVYIEPPPTAECDAAQVVKYLARYHRVRNNYQSLGNEKKAIEHFQKAINVQKL